jgi:integrase
MVWDAARDHGLVDSPSPTKSKSFRLPKIDNERQRYLTHDEEKKLLDEVQSRSEAVYTMAIISLDTGLRFSEIARLTYSCVDRDNKTLVVLNTKGKKDRNVPMTARLKGILESMAEGKPNELLFPTKEGKKQQQIPSSFVRSLAKMELNKVVENSKMRVSFHTLRHTYASRLVQAGVDLYRVQRLLGHSTPVMTARYSKLADDDLKKAVESMERAIEIKNGHNAKVVPLKKGA